MTWIVGAPVPFGYSIGCADIRVTFSDGREEDCLQKIFHVGPVVCGAFAGSVRIGFEMLSRITVLLKKDEPGMAWDLDEVAKWWPTDAREVWDRMPESEQRLRSEFMLFNAHPNQGTPWPKPCVYTFRSPDFEAIATIGPLEACSLGKGAGIRTYCDPLKSLWADEDLIRLEAGSPGGLARSMVNLITDKLLALPISGISPHMHVLLAFRDHVKATKNDRQYFKKDRSMELEPVLVMPDVSMNYTAQMIQAAINLAIQNYLIARQQSWAAARAEAELTFNQVASELTDEAGAFARELTSGDISTPCAEISLRSELLRINGRAHLRT